MIEDLATTINIGLKGNHRDLLLFAYGYRLALYLESEISLKTGGYHFILFEYLLEGCNFFNVLL